MDDVDEVDEGDGNGMEQGKASMERRKGGGSNDAEREGGREGEREREKARGHTHTTAGGRNTSSAMFYTDCRRSSFPGAAHGTVGSPYSQVYASCKKMASYPS